MLTIIIINYKTNHLVLRLLERLKNIETKGWKIIIVDLETDGFLKKNLSTDYLQVIEVSQNIGFGRANNIAFKHVNTEYVLLLNSDILVDTHEIEKCLSYIQTDATIGVLGCKLLNEDGSYQPSQYIVAPYHNLLNKNMLINYLMPYRHKEYNAVMGSFMLMPTKVMKEVGGFDPDFFLYSEDLELCHRIRKAGYKIVYYPDAVAIHKHGGSVSNKSWGYKQLYLSNALLYYKIRGFWGYLFFHSIMIANTITNVILMWKIDKHYRQNFWFEQKCYYSNFFHYFLIPLQYTKKMGNGKRMLKRS